MEKFPPHTIVVDSELLNTRPEFAFYLRVEENGKLTLVNLDKARTLQQARKQAEEEGYKPTHWVRNDRQGLIKL